MISDSKKWLVLMPFIYGVKFWGAEKSNLFFWEGSLFISAFEEKQHFLKTFDGDIYVILPLFFLTCWNKRGEETN